MCQHFVFQQVDTSIVTRNSLTIINWSVMMSNQETTTVGSYLAERLVDAGVSHFFTVPGDFNLNLLDDLVAASQLRMVSCCNELNAGYAADGYCRETGGIGCIVVTYMVGSLSALNAVAGAFSDNLPLLVVTGAPNSHDEAMRHTIHHTIGITEINQSAQCYKPVVAQIFSIRHLNEVHEKIDLALHVCGKLRKPVYLEIACNLTTQSIPPPTPLGKAYFQAQPISDNTSLQAAMETITPMLHNTAKIVLLAGSNLRSSQAVEEFTALADAMGCGVAVMPDAKGLFSESHPHYMGCYWSGVSTRHVQGIVESADIIICAGAVLNDYTTVGWTALLPAQKLVLLDSRHCEVNGRRFSEVCLKHILSGLASQAPMRPESIHNFRRYSPLPAPTEPAAEVTPDKDQDAQAQLSLRFLMTQLQTAVTSNVSCVIVETGDSWFIGQKLKLPDRVKYHVQMQYGSCGWALGACVGVGVAQAALARSAQSSQPRRMLALIGDGSFQFSAQELSTLIRQNAKVTIILLNNRTYTIEVQIHDGEYNKLVNWQYAELVAVLRDTNTTAEGLRATTNAELVQALEKSVTHSGVLLIECCIGRDDCTSSLLEWGSRVASANMR